MNSDLFLHILLIILPAGGIFLTVVLFLKKQGEKEVRHLQIELRKERQNFFLPSRVESYQRAVLLMERINPNSLVMRLHTPGLPAKAFQADLLKAIRDEFDHNVQKQLMRAASFGKCFLQHYPADKFVQKCRIIRVLNAIRDPKVGLYLTHAE